MSILTKIFSGGATKLVKGIGGVLDKLTTTKEEKLEIELKIKELVSDFEKDMEANVTSRWQSDMNSDSWLSKNVRPFSLVFLLTALTIFTLIDFGFVDISIKDTWISLWQTLSITAFGAYFGGRSFEKRNK